MAGHCGIMARSRRPRSHRRVRETAPARYAQDAEQLTGVLIDSDIIIEILRGRARPLRTALGLEEAGVPTFCTAISWAEVYAGVRPAEEVATRTFFEARGELVLDSRIGRAAGTYLARYARSHGVELADALIAAAAVASGLRLWTQNRKHYPMDDVRFLETGR